MFYLLILDPALLVVRALGLRLRVGVLERFLALGLCFGNLFAEELLSNDFGVGDLFFGDIALFIKFCYFYVIL